MTGGHEFIDRRNSSLFLVVSILFFTSLMASMAFMSAMYLRKIHMRLSVCWSWSRSSRRVLETTRLTAGKIRLFDNERSSCNSILPVPLNSSKMTSSIFEPVSINAVAMMVSEPPPSMLRAAPKKRWGNRVVGTRKTGDGIEENDHVVATLNHSLCFLQDDVGDFYMS